MRLNCELPNFYPNQRCADRNPACFFLLNTIGGNFQFSLFSIFASAMSWDRARIKTNCFRLRRPNGMGVREILLVNPWKCRNRK